MSGRGRAERRGCEGLREGVYVGPAGHVTPTRTAGLPTQCGGLAEDTTSTLPGAESAGERSFTEFY